MRFENAKKKEIKWKLEREGKKSDGTRNLSFSFSTLYLFL